MRKIIISITLLCLLLSVCGCGLLKPDAPCTQPSTQGTTTPQETTPTTPKETTPITPSKDTTPVNTTAPVDPDALIPEQIQELEAVYSTYEYLTVGFPTNWYNVTLCALFDNPKNLDVTAFFSCQGTRRLEDFRLSDKELDFLMEHPRMKANLEMEIQVYRISRTEVENLLKWHFDLEPGDVPVASDTMVYWEETDCYYVAMDGGGYGILDFQVVEAKFLDHETICFRYRDAGSGSTNQYEAVIRLYRERFVLLSNTISQ
jgi:hypothetical protein